MKIKFKKLEANRTFRKLFGLDQAQPDQEPLTREDQGDAYEYYYKRGNTYYFRNGAGEKITVDYSEPQTELVRGHRYKMEEINQPDR